MKKLLILSFCTLLFAGAEAQKGKAKKHAPAHKKTASVSGPKAVSTGIWEGTKDTDGKGPKPSKNQPAKVTAAFRRDYPTATNVSWSKYRGDWTANFHNGLISSTAVYHANGERRDTRTQVAVKQLPAIILEEIMKRSPAAQVGLVIKIDVPNIVKDIFRIKTVTLGVPKYQFFDADGREVTYDY
jgi:hypothetical protein